MKRFSKFLGRTSGGAIPGIAWVLCWLLSVVGFGSLCLQAGSLEGEVDLPKSKGNPKVTYFRYQGKKRSALASDFRSMAVVYLERQSSASPGTAPERPATMYQQEFQFNPSILPIQVGTKVVFPNHDEEYHNVFSYSPAKEFDLGRYLPQESPPTVLFDKSGFVEVGCEIHQHMRAYIVILDTPHFALTDETGTFRIRDVPDGEYRLKVWFDTKVIVEKNIEINGDVQTRIQTDSPN